MIRYMDIQNEARRQGRNTAASSASEVANALGLNVEGLAVWASTFPPSERSEIVFALQVGIRLGRKHALTR